MEDVFDYVIIISICVLALFAGYYIGFGNGLYQGAIETQNCIQNAGTGWKIEHNAFNCIF